MPPSSVDGTGSLRHNGKDFDGVEYLLFDSLVHHLIEKGLLTKNDALSVVQTAAEVVRGRSHESDVEQDWIDAAIATLERTYASFDALPGKSNHDGHNVFPLRTPLHGDRPHFPTGDD